LKAKIVGKSRFALREPLSAQACQQARLPGAINLSPERVRELAPTVRRGTQVEIVVYCGSPT
jgi:hypothetical protein